MVTVGIMDAMKQAQKIHREVLEETYTGICQISGIRSERDPKTKRTEKKEMILYEELPCRLSVSSTQVNAQGEETAKVMKNIKVFLSPEIAIAPGSKFVIIQNGITEQYKNSGKAAVYPTHQEIDLELIDTKV